MAVQTTLSSAKGWAPDVQAFAPLDAIPDALIWNATTVVEQDLQGDGPAARVPWVDDDTADFFAEGEEITEADPELAETTIYTRKLGKLLRISREQWHQDRAAELLRDSTARAITQAADEALLSLEPTGDFPLTGLLGTEGMTTSEPITEALDPLADLIGEIESAHGTPRLILANPRAWAAVRKLKTGDGYNSSLIGAGTEAEDRRLFGVPVVNSAAVPDGQLVVIDPTAIVSAVSAVQVTTSKDVFFASDSIALRATWRFGWSVMRPNRLGVVPVETPTEDD